MRLQNGLKVGISGITASAGLGVYTASSEGHSRGISSLGIGIQISTSIHERFMELGDVRGDERVVATKVDLDWAPNGTATCVGETGWLGHAGEEANRSRGDVVGLGEVGPEALPVPARVAELFPCVVFSDGAAGVVVICEA